MDVYEEQEVWNAAHVVLDLLHQLVQAYQVIINRRRRNVEQLLEMHMSLSPGTEPFGHMHHMSSVLRRKEYFDGPQHLP